MMRYLKPAINKLFWGGLRHMLSDRQYAKLRYWLELDRTLNLDNPQRFTEKIQYIKLNERTEKRRMMANREEVRSYVADTIGGEHLIPLSGIYSELTAEVWHALPRQFVLKANHGCGMIKIVFDKEEEQFTAIRDKTKQWQNFDYARFGREWAYKNLPRTIVAEELMLTKDGHIPSDYKFFCFDGEVKLIQIDFDRFGDQKRNLYDREFNQVDAELLYPKYEQPVEQPANLDTAIAFAEKLSSGMSFLRVDLYLLQDQIYFGELTNYPGNGFVPFKPDEMEYRMGSYLNLKKDTNQ